MLKLTTKNLEKDVVVLEKEFREILKIDENINRLEQEPIHSRYQAKY